VYFVSWSTGSHADLPLKYEENNHSKVIIIFKKELCISVTCEKPLDAVGVESVVMCKGLQTLRGTRVRVRRVGVEVRIF